MEMGRCERKNLTCLFLDVSAYQPSRQPPVNLLKPVKNSLAPGFYVNLTQTFSSSEALSLLAYDNLLLRGPSPT